MINYPTTFVMSRSVNDDASVRMRVVGIKLVPLDARPKNFELESDGMQAPSIQSLPSKNRSLCKITAENLTSSTNPQLVAVRDMARSTDYSWLME